MLLLCWFNCQRLAAPSPPITTTTDGNQWHAAMPPLDIHFGSTLDDQSSGSKELEGGEGEKPKRHKAEESNQRTNRRRHGQQRYKSKDTHTHTQSPKAMLYDVRRRNSHSKPLQKKSALFTASFGAPLGVAERRVLLGKSLPHIP